MTVTRSCGCIFCDIKLKAEDGYHQYKELKIPCALARPEEHIDFVIKVLRPAAIASLQRQKPD